MKSDKQVVRTNKDAKYELSKELLKAASNYILPGDPARQIMASNYIPKTEK